MRAIVAAALLAVSLGLGSVVSASTASAQLVNGSFDDVPGALAGWQVTTGVGVSITDPLSPTQSATFNQASDILEQTFSVASAGAYFLSFYVKTAGSIAGQFSSITAAINGIVVAVGGSGIANYTQSLTEVSLNAGNNTLTFTGASFAGIPDFLRLDNVTLTAVPGPLPGAGLASLLGLAGVALLARARRRKV